MYGRYVFVGWDCYGVVFGDVGWLVCCGGGIGCVVGDVVGCLIVCFGLVWGWYFFWDCCRW